MLGAQVGTWNWPARGRPACNRVAIGRLELTLDVHASLDGLEPLWHEIAAAGAKASVFQSHAWLATWARTAGRHAGEAPLVVAARDAVGRLCLLLPLGVRRHTPARLAVAGFLGQSHASYGLPLIAPTLAEALGPADVGKLFTAIARSTEIDAVNLERQPAYWGGRVNPFAAEGGIVSANDSYVLVLDRDFAGLHERLFSSRTRSTLRRKIRRLESLDGHRIGAVEHGADRHRLVDVFLAAKSRQLRESGAPDIFADPGIASFYRALLDLPRESALRLEVVAVEAAGETGAVSLMVEEDGRRYLLNTALVAPGLRDVSPGLILLTRDIESASARGCGAYDFGPGAADYKHAWQPDPVPLVTTVLPLSAAGYALAALMSSTVAAKRTIKRTPALWSAARALRRGLFGSAGGRAV